MGLRDRSTGIQRIPRCDANVGFDSHGASGEHTPVFVSEAAEYVASESPKHIAQIEGVRHYRDDLRRNGTGVVCGEPTRRPFSPGPGDHRDDPVIGRVRITVGHR